MNGYMKLNPNSLRYTKKYIINLFLTLMFDLNNSKEEQHRYKKKKEWNAIKNCIPLINEYLQLNIDPESYDDKYSRESPDFVFFNNDKSIGIEVVECRPSVMECKKKNEAERNNFERKICDEFTKNKFLLSITKNGGLNILIDRKYPIAKKRSSVQEICNELEDLLNSWYHNTIPLCERNYIERIRVSKTSCFNVIYFNSISRCIPVDWDNIKFCIEKKMKKYKDYCENVKCDEYWLCICLPFEENRNLNIIDYNGKENEALNFLSLCLFSRICITPDLLGRNINWIKEEANLLINTMNQ